MASDNKKFRIEIPNIIDDLGLDPHERALYVHYKRACGGNDCEWVESARVTGQKTKMSYARASIARKSLVDRGLISLIPKGNDGTAIQVVDIWDLNLTFYQQEDRPDIDGWTVEQLREWCQGVNNINTSPLNGCSQYEHLPQGVNNVNTSVNNINNKKEPIKNISKDSGNPPVIQKPEKKQDGPKWQLVKEFTALTGIHIPENDKVTRGFWFNKIGVILKEAGDDIDKGKKLMREAVDRLGIENVYDPNSLLKTIRKITAEKNHKPKVSFR